MASSKTSEVNIGHTPPGSNSSAAGKTSHDLINSQKELDQANRELAWELTKAGVDIAGMLDPTPFSDLTSAAMSAYEGDLVGTGLSLISCIPYLGDAIAKPIKSSRAVKKVAALSAKVKALKKSSPPPVKAVTKKAKGEVSKKAVKKPILKCPLPKLKEGQEILPGKKVVQIYNPEKPNGKAIVIGREMADHVDLVTEALKKKDIEISKFGGYSKNKKFKLEINGKQKEVTWKQIKKDLKNGNYPRYKSGPKKGYVKDEYVKDTLMYKANKQWIENAKRDGYQIIDIGYPNKVPPLGESEFYNIELKTIFK
jgi:hypothetical protein